MKFLLALLIICCLSGCGEPTSPISDFIGTWVSEDGSVKLVFPKDGKQVFFIKKSEACVFDMSFHYGKWQLKECGDGGFNFLLRIGITSDEICVAPVRQDDQKYAPICGIYTRKEFEIDLDALRLEIDE